MLQTIFEFNDSIVKKVFSLERTGRRETSLDVAALAARASKRMTMLGRSANRKTMAMNVNLLSLSDAAGMSETKMFVVDPAPALETAILDFSLAFRSNSLITSWFSTRIMAQFLSIIKNVKGRNLGGQIMEPVYEAMSAVINQIREKLISGLCHAIVQGAILFLF